MIKPFSKSFCAKSIVSLLLKLNLLFASLIRLTASKGFGGDFLLSLDSILAINALFSFFIESKNSCASVLSRKILAFERIYSLFSMIAFAVTLWLNLSFFGFSLKACISNSFLTIKARAGVWTLPTLMFLYIPNFCISLGLIM